MSSQEFEILESKRNEHIERLNKFIEMGSPACITHSQIRLVYKASLRLMQYINPEVKD